MKILQIHTSYTTKVKKCKTQIIQMQNDNIASYTHLRLFDCFILKYWKTEFSKLI